MFFCLFDQHSVSSQLSVGSTKSSLKKSRKRKLTNYDNFVKELSSPCCANECTWKFSIKGNVWFSHHFILQDCMSLCQPLLNLSEQQFTDWIKDHIKCAELANKQLIFIVKGQRICVASFCALYGISEYKFHLAEETLNKPTLHKAKGKTTINKWKAFLQTWFLNLVVSFCDLMPNSDSQYLPIYFTKTSLYNMAVQEYQDSEGSTFSQSSFFSFWKEHHKVIKIPKNLKMGQCDTCLELKRLKVSGISKTELATKVSEHNILQSKA